MNYHFDDNTSPAATYIWSRDNTFPCPFSGRYSLTGSHTALTNLLDVGQDNCHSVSFSMQAGCSSSSDLQVESTCHPRPPPAKYFYYPPPQENHQNDAPVDSSNEFVCHGQWHGESGGGGGGQRQLLLLSTGLALQRDNSVARQFMCMAFTDSDGVLSASVVRGSCNEEEGEYADDAFNVTSSGPCLQALTGGGASIAKTTVVITTLIAVAVVACNSGFI
jgi:hypothetical protein